MPPFVGINLPLAFTGQEYVWNRLYQERFNHTEEDLNEHFAGPAFLAWGRMGNIRGWGGIYEPAHVKGLTSHWMEGQRDLQKQILSAQRGLGMRPVLPAFAGHVPVAFSRHFPQADVIASGQWCGFSNRWSNDALLNASDPLFVKVSQAFIEIQTEEYGTDHIYNGDTFNELAPASHESNYLDGWGKAVYLGMAAGKS